MLVLPQASCHKCADETHALEGRVIHHMYSGIRPHLHIRRKRNKKYDALLKVTRRKHGVSEKIEVEIDEHPGAAPIMILRQSPGILRGVPPSEDWGNADLGFWTANLDFESRIAQIGGAVNLGGDISLNDLSRFWAKIAHSYAVARLGYGKFDPFLTKAIMSKVPSNMPYFVGAYTTKALPSLTDNLHHLVIAGMNEPGGNRELLVASVRLFACYGFPVYDVVVGATNGLTPSP